MSHWGSEQGGVREVRDWECCVKRVQANERDKRGCGCIQCAGGVSVSEATSEPHFPLPSLAFYATDGEYIYLYIYLSKRRETICLSVIAGSVKLRTWRRASLDRVFLPLLLSPSLLLVERGAVWGWRYNPEQRSLEARNERVEASFAIIFEIRPNASVRPTIVHRLLVFFDEALGTEKGGKGQKNK